MPEARGRIYNAFSKIQFGDCAWREDSEYFKDIVYLETNFASRQHDVGYVG